MASDLVGPERLDQIVAPIAEAEAWAERIDSGHGKQEDYFSAARHARALLWAIRTVLVTPGLRIQELRHAADGVGLAVAPWHTGATLKRERKGD